MKHVLFIMAAACLLTGCSSEQTLKKTDDKKEAAEDSQQEERVKEEEAAKEPEKEEPEEEMISEQPAEPKYTIDPANWTIKPLSGNVNSKTVLLTIDDAPDKNSLEMAHILKELGVKAIFFVNGHFIDSEEEKKVLKEIHDLGFPIGNHTLTHANLKDLSIEEQRKEIIGLNDQVEAITGERPQFFRAPFGSNTDDSRKIAEEEKMVLMNWTYGYDWVKDYQTKEALTDIMVNSPYLTDGANLLMHDREWTKAALKGIVEGLIAKGYEIANPDFIKKIS
ncbi:polysaccharide deacetylase family protein [Bacillus sp. UMB0893]|uniref:polysaccharide deacetylase family protein n=1 Tax=Bacillus sp. UMB0893 TaxID=2066053 RepID=UPI000C76283F|nr:polysaccharide deacetylase family protein [Bacillus sp. UMB0893]PLR69568.1 polysaccharide deacetylase [Bacillus sp. UMB0893]